MSVTSICQICESATANHTCGSCGATVCQEHYDDSKGLCSACMSGTRM